MAAAVQSSFAAPLHPPPLGGTVSGNQFGFPIESDEVLLNTLTKIGIVDVKESDLQKPTQQIALTCFTAFLELLSYVNEDVVDMLKRDCLDRLEHKEMYDDALQIVIRFREIRALMIASCVPDFNLSDILRPKAKRFKRHMFALINFLRFSEHHIQHFDRLKEESDKVSKTRSELEDRISSYTRRLENLENDRKTHESTTLALRESNATLSDMLRKLKEEQSSLLNELEDVKQDKNLMHSRLLKLIESSRHLQEELGKLRLRMENTPLDLKVMIDKHRRQLQEKNVMFAEEEAKSHVLFSKRTVLEKLENDISSCSSAVQECLAEQTKLERETNDLSQLQRDAKEVTRERENLVVGMDQLGEKLKWAMERLERLQQNIDGRREQNRIRKEQGAKEWQATQLKRGERKEVVDSLTAELFAIVAEFDTIADSFDSFHNGLLERKEQLERQCGNYMRAISRKVDIQVDL